MDCPTCGKELRQMQVETMLGNPDFNEWCRNGYCSNKCYESRNPDDEPIPIRPAHTGASEEQKVESSIGHSEKAISREPVAYSLATYSIIAVPLYLALSLLGRIFGVHKSPEAAMYYFGILFVVIMITGFVAAILAIIAIRKYGSDRLLWKSIIGILLVSGFTYLGVSGLMESLAEQGGVE